MGHYDSCYASDDYAKMSAGEKAPYVQKFKERLQSAGHVHAYYDDVGGLILREYAEGKSDLIIKSGYGSIEVKTKAYVEKEQKEYEEARLKRLAEEAEKTRIENEKLQKLREAKEAIRKKFKNEVEGLITDEYDNGYIRDYALNRLLDKYEKDIAELKKTP